ncbi:MAG: sensor histidine kinase [Planctomycetota bacterium]
MPDPPGRPGKHVAFETARLALSRLPVGPDGPGRAAGVRHATEICARALAVERVSFWSFSPARDAISCEDLFLLSSGQHEPGEAPLRVEDFPAYFAAMGSRKAIVAHDARTDPATRELAEPYLRPRGITSMLDAPVFLAGEVIGVVCHEHVGEARTWSQSEIDFASSVADMISIVLEQSQRLAVEGELRALAARHADRARLEALGRLARGVAHDFRNVLHALRMGLEVQRRQGALSAEAQRELLASLEVGEHLAGELTLAPHAPDAERCCPDTVAAELTPLLRRMVQGQATLALELGAPGVSAPLSPTHVEQVLLNLVVNAGEAVAASGKGAGQIVVSTRPEAGGVALEVHDEGVGMSEELLAHAREPYVSGRPDGSGLGLATVDALVAQAGGTLDLQSAPGAGTTARVVLPGC